MCCQMCLNMHKGHTKAYFKDPFIEANYSNIDQTQYEVLQLLGTNYSKQQNLALANVTKMQADPKT